MFKEQLKLKRNYGNEGNLILSRKEGESIMIGDNIEVTVLPQTNRGQTRIAIAAPKDLAIHRREIYNKIQMEKAALPRDDEDFDEDEVMGNY